MIASTRVAYSPILDMLLSLLSLAAAISHSGSHQHLISKYVLATPILLEEHPAGVGVEIRVWAPECFVVVDIVPTICMNQLEHIAVQLRKRMSP